MKTAIVYYSFSGNTHSVAQAIRDYLKDKGDDVTLVRLTPLKEDTNFFKQCCDAYMTRKPEIFKTVRDLKDFDRLIIGSPLWAFKPAPPVNTYLSECEGLDGKTAVCFMTSGSGLGNERALSLMRGQLEKKGANVAGIFCFTKNENADSCVGKMSKVL